MKIILDNREITMNNIDDKSFSWVLEEVTDLLERDGRMLFDVYIDGKGMDYYEYFNKEQIGVVEFISKSPKIIILESLGEMSGFISKYFDALMAIAGSFNSNRTTDAVEILLEVENGLEWVYNVLASMKENTAIDFRYPEFDMMFLEYRTILERVQECTESGDYIGGLTLLEVDMSSELIFLQENLDAYMKDIIDEEIDEYKYN
ncbi:MULTISPECIES: hypothetical protein [Psychrilyobacter]|uniref:DUF4375 domain-containing protein n=1 Tax=Psychrilyobacter piezotolerans TaxID=2293438 RepID=A0ABX9KL55_9FUSO|nr:MULTISPECIES: hypothetical protein [Psychrilyobacter]MCS5421848.1 hypothetical protein [Psychrilyobacter sp. S5]NDI76739.1 hypothetical protein [Psychrilyobacter piezotolerans]RDE65358.1 hypothetical protein DV867_02180 [Psychrilyobacter sp. S5]REI42976.1 hypothetical protein DYH56_02180 [Psychrilyobacter piezotolerans]